MSSKLRACLHGNTGSFAGYHKMPRSAEPRSEGKQDIRFMVTPLLANSYPHE